MVKITDLFKEDELKEKGDGNYKTICPDCGLQGGREEGFILFPETNTWFCHSSQRWGGILELVAIKGGFINCVESHEKGESKGISEIFKEIDNWEFTQYFKEQFPKVYEYFLHSQNKGKNYLLEMDNFLYWTKVGKQLKLKPNHDRIADYIINKHEIKTIYGVYGQSMYVYSNGIWTKTGRGKIIGDIESLLGTHSKNNVVNEIIEKIKRKTQEDAEEFNEVPDYMACVKNGVLDLSDVNDIKFLPHNKKYNFKSKFPINYDSNADCPYIKWFVNNTFKEKDIPQIQEWIGFHLIRKYIYKKGVIISGKRDTGKTVFVNLLTKFCGEENVAGLSLQKIGAGKGFDVIRLKDKKANISDDLSSKDIGSSGGFKMAVGDGYIEGEEKFGDRTRFQNTAKNTYTCNEIPSVKDDYDDEAYYKRWIIWTLENTIPQEQQDPHLIEKLTTDKELSGLLNWAIEGYVRLVKQNKFSNEKEPKEIMSLMKQHGNHLAEFCVKKLIKSPGKTITKQDMYEKYIEFCENHEDEITAFTKDKLGKQLRRFAPYVGSSSNGKEKIWTNVEVVDNNDNSEELGENDENSSKTLTGMTGSDTFFLNPSASNNENLNELKLKSVTTDRYDFFFNSIARGKNKIDNNEKRKSIDVLFQNPSYLSVSDNKEKPEIKDYTKQNKSEEETLLSDSDKSDIQTKRSSKKKNSDREVQFWEAKECEDIKPNCTKEQVEQFLKNNPKASCKDVYEKFGVGSIKYYSEVLK